jgi:hypothetical protein
MRGRPGMAAGRLQDSDSLSISVNGYHSSARDSGLQWLRIFNGKLNHDFER